MIEEKANKIFEELMNEIVCLKDQIKQNQTDLGKVLVNDSISWLEKEDYIASISETISYLKKEFNLRNYCIDKLSYILDESKK